MVLKTHWQLTMLVLRVQFLAEITSWLSYQCCNHVNSFEKLASWTLGAHLWNSTKHSSQPPLGKTMCWLWHYSESHVWLVCCILKNLPEAVVLCHCSMPLLLSLMGFEISGMLCVLSQCLHSVGLAWSCCFLQDKIDSNVISRCSQRSGLFIGSSNDLIDPSEIGTLPSTWPSINIIPKSGLATLAMSAHSNITSEATSMHCEKHSYWQFSRECNTSSKVLAGTNRALARKEHVQEQCKILIKHSCILGRIQDCCFIVIICLWSIGGAKSKHLAWKTKSSARRLRCRLRLLLHTHPCQTPIGRAQCKYTLTAPAFSESSWLSAIISFTPQWHICSCSKDRVQLTQAVVMFVHCSLSTCSSSSDSIAVIHKLKI